MAILKPVNGDPFATSANPLEGALQAEGITGQLADVARSVYMQESDGGRNTKTSNAGAVGGMQIIPATFQRVADPDWDIANPDHNARAGVRYLKKLSDLAGGDPRLTAVGYYGGEGAIDKARRGVAVSDPRNPNAPNTLQYGDQVAGRLPKAQAGGVRLREVEGNPFAVEQPVAQAPAAPAQPEPGFIEAGMSRLANGPVGTAVKDLVTGQGLAGAVRGAGSIGSTLMQPVDAAARALGVQNDFVGRTDRRDAMDSGLQQLGANPDSNVFQAAKLGTEVAGTMGVGGAIARPIAGVAPRFAQAIASGGMRGGSGPVNMLLRSAGGAISGGASAGLIDPQAATTGAALGAALPPAIAGAGRAGGAIASALRGGGVSPEVQALATRAKDLGIDIPADRLVDSKPLNAVASGLNYVPFSGRAATEAKMEKQLTQAATRLFGENSDNMTMALRKANQNLGTKFDDTLRNTAVRFDQQLLDDVAEVANRAEAELGADALKPINAQIKNLVDKGAEGAIDGQAAYNIKRELDRIGRANTPTAYHALELKGKLMDALNRSLGDDGAKAFAETRRQYSNMLALEKLAKNGVEGDISVARLANMKNINNSELQEIADIAAQFVKPREGQHGAMQRGFAALGIGGMGGPASLAGVSAAARGTNSLLNSSTARRFVSATPSDNALLQGLRNPELREAVVRAAPGVSAR